MFYYIFLLLRATLRILTAFAQEAATEGNEVYEQPAAVTVEAIPEQPVEDPVPEPIPEAAVPEKAIIDEDRRKNAELIEEAFYQRKNLHPDMHDEKDKMIEVQQK